MSVEICRSTIFDDGRERLTLIGNDNGSLELLRSTDVDDGPPRSCPIPAAALPELRRALAANETNNGPDWDGGDILMATERVHVSIELTWDPKKEDRRGALAATFAGMAEGIANGRTGGTLPNKGSWTIRKGAEDFQ